MGEQDPVPNFLIIQHSENFVLFDLKAVVFRIVVNGGEVRLWTHKGMRVIA